MIEKLEATGFVEPFPHLIFNDFYNKRELELIWEELNFYTKPEKFLQPKNYGGIETHTDSKAILLDNLYKNYSKVNPKDGINYRKTSNILTVNRKVLSKEVLEAFSKLHPCCKIITKTNWDITKVRYYHDGDYYKPHTDASMQFLAFSYFYKKPKKFTGGELFFPEYDYELTCDDNSLIMFPGWVEHGVKKVSIKDSDYHEGNGRYCISSFINNVGR